MYGTTNNTSGPVTFTIQYSTVWSRTVWSGNNYPIDPDQGHGLGSSRRLAGLDRMIKEFGKKLALARHWNILHANAIIREQLRRVRRSGAPLLTGVRHLSQRRGRVCGESNYYRAMLC